MRKRLGRSAEWEMPSGLAADDHISWPAATRIARDQAWDAASGYSVGTRTDGKEKVSTACLSPRLAAPARSKSATTQPGLSPSSWTPPATGSPQRGSSHAADAVARIA